jgi:two-component system KDP operon response regulator KdpE
MTDTPRVLIVDDQLPVRRFLRHGLEGPGCRVLEATDGREALSLAAPYLPDVVLLDLGLPDQDGVEVCRALREWFAGAIVILSARDQESAKVEALDAGADDYITKPVGFPELLARLRVALRHVAAQGGGSEAVLKLGTITLDLSARRVLRDGSDVHLTPTEYRLLVVLARAAGKVVTQRQLIGEVWGPRAGDKAHDLRVYMARLREKLDPDPDSPEVSQTELGVGYRLMVHVEAGL